MSGAQSPMMRTNRRYSSGWLFILLFVLSSCNSDTRLSEKADQHIDRRTPAAIVLPHTRPATSTPASTPFPTPAATSAITAFPEQHTTATARPEVWPSSTATQPATASPAPELVSEFDAAMRPGFASDLQANADRPRINLRLRLDPAARKLTGTQQISYTNRTGIALQDIALRLYPNYPRDVFGGGGSVQLEITTARVEGQPVEIHYTAQRTAVLLPLGRPLAPGETVSLQLAFQASIQPERDATWALPSYYPMLAVYDQGWRLDVTHFADKVYSETALYTVEITAPSQLSVAASGSTVARRDNSDGTTTYAVRSGPIRDFVLICGDFIVAKDRAGDVAVNVYTARHAELDAREIARTTAAALTVFDQRFGPYPYAELDVHLLPGAFDGGAEYPGMILLYSDGQVDAGTRYVTAHEVAHQWWYGVVGNDIYRQPWLDEALAQYSAIVYGEDVAGPATASADWEREVLRRHRAAVADGDLPVGLPIDGYPSFNVYYRTIYGKGAFFLRVLRDELGDEAFFGALQRYYRQNRYAIGTTEEIQKAFEISSGRNLDTLFQRWVTGR